MDENLFSWFGHFYWLKGDEKMVSVSYSEAVTEVLDILKHTKKEDVENITNKIHEEFEIDKPGKGIIFSMPVDKAIGLV